MPWQRPPSHARDLVGGGQGRHVGVGRRADGGGGDRPWVVRERAGRRGGDGAGGRGGGGGGVEP